MARIQYGSGVIDIKGSIGGCTFQHNRSGSIVRARPKGQRISTEGQQKSHLDQNNYLREWQLLDLPLKQEWNDYADVWEREDLFGNLRRLTGLNWFSSINRNRVSCGLSIVTTPPMHILPESVPSYCLCITEADITINFSEPFNPLDTSLFVRSTAPFKRVSQSIASDLRLNTIFSSPPWLSVTLTSGWIKAHGIPWPPAVAPHDFYIGVMVQTVHKKSGIASVGLMQINEVTGTDVGIGDMIIQCSFVVRPLSGIGWMKIGTTFIVS